MSDERKVKALTVTHWPRSAAFLVTSLDTRHCFLMDDLIARLPKAELHLHLEGTVGAEALWRLAQRHASPLCHEGREAVDSLYATASFGDFLQAFKTICQHLRDPEDYEAITYDALRKLAEQHVLYAEITLSAGVILWKGEELEASFSGVEEGARRARDEFGIRVQWIFDAVRQFGPEAAMEVARRAAALQDRGVVAFGIGGDERKVPAELFREVFAYARGEGLRLTVHAGETAGPESVWGAIELLGAERIGHGLTAAQDSRLIEYLAANQIPLEVCLTSNLRTGCLAELEQHPLPQLLERGVAISLNSDDPALFGTDLCREYRLAQRAFGLSDQQLRALARTSFVTAFLSEEERNSYLAALEAF